MVTIIVGVVFIFVISVVFVFVVGVLFELFTLTPKALNSHNDIQGKIKNKQMLFDCSVIR